MMVRQLFILLTSRELRKTKNLTTAEMPEEQHRVKILAAIDKTESEWMKKA